MSTEISYTLYCYWYTDNNNNIIIIVIIIISIVIIIRLKWEDDTKTDYREMSFEGVE